jgi:hypothetical protein
MTVGGDGDDDDDDDDDDDGDNDVRRRTRRKRMMMLRMLLMMPMLTMISNIVMIISFVPLPGYWQRYSMYQPYRARIQQLLHIPGHDDPPFPPDPGPNDMVIHIR